MKQIMISFTLAVVVLGGCSSDATDSERVAEDRVPPSSEVVVAPEVSTREAASRMLRAMGELLDADPTLLPTVEEAEDVYFAGESCTSLVDQMKLAASFLVYRSDYGLSIGLSARLTAAVPAALCPSWTSEIAGPLAAATGISGNEADRAVREVREILGS